MCIRDRPHTEDTRLSGDAHERGRGERASRVVALACGRAVPKGYLMHRGWLWSQQKKWHAPRWLLAPPRLATPVVGHSALHSLRSLRCSGSVAAPPSHARIVSWFCRRHERKEEKKKTGGEPAAGCDRDTGYAGGGGELAAGGSGGNDDRRRNRRTRNPPDEVARFTRSDITR